MKLSKNVLGIGAFLILCLAWFMYESPPSKDKEIPIVLPTINKAHLAEEKIGGGLNWELDIEEMSVDAVAQKNLLKGVKGKLYRPDGSFISVVAQQGEINMRTKDFLLKGAVEVVSSKGEKLNSKELLLDNQKELITARGDVVILNADTVAKADQAVTDKKFENIKLSGNASIKRGGE